MNRNQPTAGAAPGGGMRAATVTALCVAVFISCSFAKGGVMATVGLNFAGLAMDNAAEDHWMIDFGGGIDEKQRAGVNMGLGYEIPLTGFLTLVPGVAFETGGKKWRSRGSLVPIDYTYDIRLQYVRVPIMAAIWYGIGPVRVRAEAGPDLGILLDAEEWVWNNTGDSTMQDRDVDGEFKTVDFALSFAGGAEYRVGPGRAFAKIGYCLGMVDINDADRGGDVFNRLLRVNAGYVYEF